MTTLGIKPQLSLFKMREASKNKTQKETDETMHDGALKDIVILHIPKLKVSLSLYPLTLCVQFILLEFDPDVSEFAVYCIYNLENQPELQMTGKMFPNTGMLRSVSTHWFTGFGFIADDTTFSWVQLQDPSDQASGF